MIVTFNRIELGFLWKLPLGHVSYHLLRRCYLKQRLIFFVSNAILKPSLPSILLPIIQNGNEQKIDVIGLRIVETSTLTFDFRYYNMVFDTIQKTWFN